MTDNSQITAEPRKPSTVKRMLIMLFLVVVLVAALGFGFYRHIQTLIASAPKQTPATVSTTVVAASPWQAHIDAVGSLSAVSGVDVATQVAGIVTSIPVQSGSTVAAGTVLLQLNIDPDKAQLASLQAAADLSEIVQKRDMRLLTSSAVSQATLDTDAADVKSRNALVAQQEALIAQKTVKAPFAGDLGIVQVNIGQYLTPGTVIATLQDLSAMHVDFLVPQGQVASLQSGQAVNIMVDAYPGRSFSGKIIAINPKVDPNTRNATVRALVPNSDKLLRPGMFVRTAVDVGAPKDYLTLPLTAITYNSYGATVFVLSPSADGKGKVAKQIFVTTGDTRGDQVQVVKGLTAGQEVVTSGQLKLKTGAAVVVDNSVQPPNDPNAAPQEQ
jgi:membrane fusion protein, multidrug efflux system